MPRYDYRRRVEAVCHRTGRVISIRGSRCTEQRFPICDGCTYRNLLAPSIGEKRAEGGSPLGRRWSFSFNATKRAEVKRNV